MKGKRMKTAWSQKNTNTSPTRLSPTTTSSGRTTRILPTPTGTRHPVPLLPTCATRAEDGDGVAGPAESVEESAGDAGANVRAVGSRRWCNVGEVAEGVKGGAAGLSFRAVLASAAAGLEDFVAVVARLVYCFKAVVILRMNLIIHAGCDTTASTNKRSVRVLDN
jgi:hypothetical protein